jgi:hypothetical protein
LVDFEGRIVLPATGAPFVATLTLQGDEAAVLTLLAQINGYVNQLQMAQVAEAQQRMVSPCRGCGDGGAHA